MLRKIFIIILVFIALGCQETSLNPDRYNSQDLKPLDDVYDKYNIIPTQIDEDKANNDYGLQLTLLPMNEKRISSIRTRARLAYGEDIQVLPFREYVRFRLVPIKGYERVSHILTKAIKEFPGAWIYPLEMK